MEEQKNLNLVRQISQKIITGLGTLSNDDLCAVGEMLPNSYLFLYKGSFDAELFKICEELYNIYNGKGDFLKSVGYISMVNFDSNQL